MGILTTLDAPVLPRRVPPRQVPAARAHLPRPVPLPAGQARRQGADPPLRRLAGGDRASARTSPRTLRLRRAAEAHGATAARRAASCESLELEGERLGRYAGSFGDRLFAHLTKLYDLARAEAVRVYQARLDEAVRAGGRQAAARRRAGAADGVRGGPQALRAREEGLEAGARRRGGAALARRRSPSASTASTGTTSCATTASASRAAASRRPRNDRRLSARHRRRCWPPPRRARRLARTLEPASSPRRRSSDELIAKLKRDIFKVDRAIGETEQADRQEPQRAVPARPAVPPRRALRGEEPLRVLPAGRDAARGREGRDGLARDASCSSRRRCRSTTGCCASTPTSTTATR